MQNASTDEAQAGIKMARRNLNNLRYADDTILMAESEEELKSFLMRIQTSQEAGKMIWYFHLFKYFPPFVVIHTVKVFGVVNKAEVDVFLEFFCFFYDRLYVGNLLLFLCLFLNILKFLVHVLLKPGFIQYLCTYNTTSGS